MEENYETPISKASVKAISKRRYAMIILKFLLDHSEEACYNAEVSRLLDICEVTSMQNFDKLVASGLVRRIINNPVDRKVVYYELSDTEIAEKVVEKWKRHIGYELSRFVPVARTPAERIKQDKNFARVCHGFRISLDEGIECLRKCPVVICESYRDEWIFLRKEAYKEKEMPTVTIPHKQVEVSKEREVEEVG